MPCDEWGVCHWDESDVTDPLSGFPPSFPEDYPTNDPGFDVGWFGDLINNAEQVGQDYVDSQINQAATNAKNSGNQSVHIPVQNETVAAFGQILNNFKNGILSSSQTYDLISRYDQGFQLYCQKLGYARALRGAADVHALAVQLLGGLTPPAPGTSPDTPITPGTPVSTVQPPGILSTIQANPLLLLLGGYLLIKKL